jgi:tetratricopeptide (TPR) repeat protein
MPRLRELAEVESADNFYTDNKWQTLFRVFFPEVLAFLKKIKVKEYKEMWLLETEKMLRRLRLMSLRIDRFSDLLIKKIRKQVNRSFLNSNNDVSQEFIEENKVLIQNSTEKLDLQSQMVEWKKNEQKLILEIAKNPKNSALYEELGDLYIQMGNYSDAKESFEAAIELNPNKEELKKKLFQVLEKLV